MSRIDTRMADLKAKQEAGTYTLCPRCGRNTMKTPLHTNALSRLADIMVCEDCGMDEAKLAWMRNPGTVYSWAALQPRKPQSDFKALRGKQVWERIQKEQGSEILKLYHHHTHGVSDEEVQYEAFEELPGLTQIWTEPFHLRYKVADGEIVVRLQGNEFVADLVE